MRILVVEDSRRLQRTLALALRRSGYSVDLADDGEEGLWLAQSHEYDVMVLDVMLPKRDGLSILSTLRAQGHTTHVLLLTARDTIADRDRRRCAAADPHAARPWLRAQSHGMLTARQWESRLRLGLWPWANA